MANRASIGLAVVLTAASTGMVLAQGSTSTGQTMPDSNMAPPAGNTGEANNGIGHQGGLTGNAGTHSSTVKGAAAAAAITTSPKPASQSHNDPAVEKDPSQGGGQQR